MELGVPPAFMVASLSWASASACLACVTLAAVPPASIEASLD